jgi:hypothetical protein
VQYTEHEPYSAREREYDHNREADGIGQISYHSKIEIGEMHIFVRSLFRGSFGGFIWGVLVQRFEGEGGEALGAGEGFVFDSHFRATGEAAVVFFVHFVNGNAVNGVLESREDRAVLAFS